MKTLQKSLNFFLFLKTEASKIRLCFVFDFARWMALFWVECFHAWPEECIFLIIRMIHRWNFQRFAFWEFRRVTRECKIRHLETMIPLYQYFFYYRTRCYCRIITLEAHARFTSEWALRAECGFYFCAFVCGFVHPGGRIVGVERAMVQEKEGSGSISRFFDFCSPRLSFKASSKTAPRPRKMSFGLPVQFME